VRGVNSDSAYTILQELPDGFFQRLDFKTSENLGSWIIQDFPQ
jgi:hypothetical protein